MARPGVEQVGSTRNLWLEEPGTRLHWLHKDTVIPASGTEQGEDWSEVISTQVAVTLGVPCAPTRLCTRDGRRGSLSMSIRPPGQDLWEGRVVLENGRIPGCFSHTEDLPGVDPDRPDVKRPGHSLANIKDALTDVIAPRTFEGPSAMTGFDIFAGYMVLDALIANRDRHEQNWAVLAPQLLTESVRLAPSYDHASSLGYNLPDARRELNLTEASRLEAWAAKGTAYRFEHVGKPPTLVEHAARAVALATPEGADWWRERLSTCNLSALSEVLRDGVIAEMSDAAVTFADDLLDLNLRRLRDAINEHA